MAIASMAIALAGPGRPETQVTRTGYGAEIVVLMDRSRSMDQRMLPSDWRTIDALDLPSQAPRPRAGQIPGRARSAGAIRPSAPYGSIRGDVLQHQPIECRFVHPARRSGAGGDRGGRRRPRPGRHRRRSGDARAIGEFEPRPYSGSRIILLVFDGGAHLDDATRRRIRAGMLRHRHRALLDLPPIVQQSDPRCPRSRRRGGAGNGAAPFLPDIGDAVSGLSSRDPRGPGRKPSPMSASSRTCRSISSSAFRGRLQPLLRGGGGARLSAAARLSVGAAPGLV